MTRRRDLGLVALGGAGGALLRVALAEVFPARAGGLPWSTLVENVVGALALGVLVGVLAARQLAAPRTRALLGAGLLGAFTSYSTFAVEVVSLSADGRADRAGVYVAASLVLGLLAAVAGLRLGRLVGRRGGGPGSGPSRPAGIGGPPGGPTGTAPEGPA